MQSAVLTIRGDTTDLEFRIVAFDDGSASVWQLQDGHPIGKSIDFASVGENAIKGAVQQLLRKYPNRRTELAIEP